MKITIVGTGHVGLVTGVCLAEVGHQVACYDIDLLKIEQLKLGIAPYYEPHLERLLNKNINCHRLSFTHKMEEALFDSKIVLLAVGTPQNEDGSVNLQYIEKAAAEIGAALTNDTIIVTKSTVPVGTNKKIKQIIEANLRTSVQIDIISNPEFLREGSAIYDTFHSDRIIIGYENELAGNIIEEMYKPFNISFFKTNLNSAEMIKYASNAFLATKISFINEIAQICEAVDADIEDVSLGMGLDSRIGTQHLKAGIGYGGSCFPKDTNALLNMAQDASLHFEVLDAVMNVNKKQQKLLIEKAKKLYGSLNGKKIALLGLAFKPNTDDVRESSAIAMAQQLIQEGAQVTAYDPLAIENAKQIIGDQIQYAHNIEQAIKDADLAFIATELDEVKDFRISLYEELMKTPIVLDGRNCYSLNEVEKYHVDYISIGRQPLRNVYSKVNKLS